MVTTDTFPPSPNDCWPRADLPGRRKRGWGFRGLDFSVSGFRLLGSGWHCGCGGGVSGAGGVHMPTPLRLHPHQTRSRLQWCSRESTGPRRKGCYIIWKYLSSNGSVNVDENVSASHTATRWGSGREGREWPLGVLKNLQILIKELTQVFQIEWSMKDFCLFFWSGNFFHSVLNVKFASSISLLPPHFSLDIDPFYYARDRETMCTPFTWLSHPTVGAVCQESWQLGLRCRLSVEASEWPCCCSGYRVENSCDSIIRIGSVLVKGWPPHGGKCHNLPHRHPVWSAGTQRSDRLVTVAPAVPTSSCFDWRERGFESGRWPASL